MYQCWCFIVEFNLGVCGGTASLASICNSPSRLRRHATKDFQLLAGPMLHPTPLYHVETYGSWIERTCRLRDCTLSLHQISNSSLHHQQLCKSATTSLLVIHIQPWHNDQQPVNNILQRRGCLCSDLLLLIPHRTASSTILSQTPPGWADTLSSLRSCSQSSRRTTPS
jgi:hypothetical protein